MKVLVTGGSGFIGSHLVDALVSDGHQVTVMDLWKSKPVEVHEGQPGFRFVWADVEDAFWVSSLCAEADVVFHLAAILGTAETVEEFGLREVIETNLIGLSYALDAVKSSGGLLIYLTSPDVTWLNPYRITKQAAEKFCLMYQGLGTRVAVLRAGNVYGPRERWSDAPLGAPYNYRKVVPTFIRQALQGKPLIIYGDGEQRAPYVYVADLVQAMLRVMSRYDDWGIIPIGREPILSVNELAHKILEATGSQSGIIHLPMRAGERKLDCHLDTSLARTLLGFKARTSIKNGLAQTVPYYVETV